MYITIEGVIGAGKTSLTNILSECFNAHPIYEIVEENPYLEKFYADQDKYAFQTEMFFLTDRCNQMKDIQEKYLHKEKDIIVDYNLAKSLIFSQKTLKNSEYKKFEQIYNILVSDYAKPDLIIIIKSSISTLKKHIKMRNRKIEQHIEDDYLEYLIKKYDEYIKILEERFPQKILIIKGDKFDFVNNNSHKEQIVSLVKRHFPMK